MRVLYLAPAGRTPEQLSRYAILHEEIQALAEAGVEAYVLSTASPTDIDRGRIHIRSVPNKSIGEFRKTLAFLGRTRRAVPFANLGDPVRCQKALRIERIAAEVIQRERISLIHSYFGWPRGYGGMLARAATGVPLVAGLRGSDVNVNPAIRYGFRLNRSFDRTVRRLLRTCDASVYVSDFLKRRAEELGARPESGRVILKGVRQDAFRARQDRDAVRRTLGWGSEPVILAVSGLVPIKGLTHVLEALSHVRAAGHAFSFVMCGDGPEQAALAQSARQLGLGDRVRFAGRVVRAEIPAYFAGADIFVHGALIEASGNVLLEAMSSGLPIVCTDAGGPAEYVLDGINGFVVPVAAPEAMAQRIVLLLEDSSLRQRLGRQGRLRAETDLAYQRMIDETLTTYESVLGERNGLASTAKSTA